ncbi:DEKNAAC100541 [Brettanomyces naardenensis]|uniref:DEKNAAC100541 n=1 Tax=Brettanomyces naardenensis TaxID=13370 RepID=A0A448YFY6_BRENA|nr:DEKNAAC100541 [Brettanomyces naardenensis]
MAADDSTSATLYRSSIRRSSGVNDIKPRVFLGPIDDYGFDENEELSDAESLLSRPFRKVGYSIISRRESDQSDGYGSMNVLRDGEHLDPQYYYNSPHDFKSIYYRQNMMLKLLTNTLYMLIGLAVAFVTTRLVVLKNCDDSLSDFTITSLDNILMSDELLLFEVMASSRNTNLQDVSIWNMAVDVFLRTDSSLLESPPIISSVSNDIAILLGNSTTFVTPLNFQGILTSDEGVVNGTFTSLPGEIWRRLTHKSEIRPHLSSGQVKIQHPGRNFRYEGEPLSSDQWSRILNSKYNLIVRGSFNYHLPLMPNNNVVSVATEVEVKPEK